MNVVDTIETMQKEVQLKARRAIREAHNQDTTFWLVYALVNKMVNYAVGDTVGEAVRGAVREAVYKEVKE
jgi:hypothetical protein